MRNSRLHLALFTTLVASAISGRAEAEDPFTAEDRAYWALQPVARPSVPTVKQAEWPRNAIDAFILARLEAEIVAPAPAAERRMLLRRLTFDLWGLPPTPEQTAAFLADESSDAYERLVDRLLASPHYGERWARHWLDLVRYAETNGFKADELRPDAWRYRDWVVASLNDDMPYDRFIAMQVAGDELAPEDTGALVATGFLRHWPYESNQIHVRQQCENILNDVADITGQALLGLTIRCARCHDHKYDPILQRDYYRLQAFFAGLRMDGERPLATPAEQAEYAARLAGWEEATAEVRAQLAEIERDPRRGAREAKKQRFPPDVQRLIDTPRDALSLSELQWVLLAERQLDVPESDMLGRMNADVKQQWQTMRTALAEYDSLRPEPLPGVQAAAEIGPLPPPTYIPGGGANGDQTDPIEPGYLTILDPASASVASPVSAESSGRRSALARWLTDPANPLTARVIVNRLWQQHFGVGLVATPNDFGRQGSPPSHPELLDWLAGRLVDDGWSLKSLQRLMVTSAAYRQSALAAPSERARQVDPDNRLLWRMRTRRLEAEAVRDALLAVSGELNPRMAGPGVYDELPAGLVSSYAWQPSPEVAERRRRSIYLVARRNLSDPLLDVFDLPDTHDSCARRDVTTTPPQALYLLNGQWTLDRAAALAGRLLARDDRTDTALIGWVYELALARPATADEVSQGVEFLTAQTAAVDARLAAGEAIALPANVADDYSPARSAALVDYCHTLLNSNEFVYVD